MGKSVTIYWSGSQDISPNNINENMLYYPPESLFKSLLLDKNKNLQGDKSNFFQCPAFKDKAILNIIKKNVLED